VSGSLNGCAADVEVAVGGVCEDEESPWRAADCVAVVAEMGVADAARRGVVVVRKRVGCRRVEVEVGIWAREADRRQLRHIILGLCARVYVGVAFNWYLWVLYWAKSLRWDGKAAEVFRRFR
jgi:hypothetical protein